MDLSAFLPFRWRIQALQATHARAIGSILNTPPIIPQNDGVVLFSMMGTAVMLPYLVAVKSVWANLHRGRVVILNDGTLSDKDRAMLAYHCGDPEIIEIASVPLGAFPKGGTWERFLTILDRRGDDYWIQIDSDTVARGPLTEVADAIAANRSFALGGDANGADIGIIDATTAVQRLHPNGAKDNHVQTRIETQLDRADPARGWRYFRGCSGFAGFSKGGPGRSLAAAFLAHMKDTIGAADVTQWGTEQVASNFQLANEDDTIVLPYARYLNYWAQPFSPDAAFVHFVGTYRYQNGAYANESQRAIAALRGA